MNKRFTLAFQSFSYKNQSKKTQRSREAKKSHGRMTNKVMQYKVCEPSWAEKISR